MQKLSELNVKHPYYCSLTNYHADDRSYRYDKWSDFCSVSDIDMNLCFRFDFMDNMLYLFVIQQRKGIFCVHIIDSVVEGDLVQIREYLTKHFKRNMENWSPFSDEMFNYARHNGLASAQDSTSENWESEVKFEDWVK